MIDAEGHMPSFLAFLVGWQAPGLDGTGLAVLLVGHVLTGAVPPLQRAAAEHLALRTDQMVPPVDGVPLGDHAALLVGMDRYVGRVRRQRHRL